MCAKLGLSQWRIFSCQKRQLTIHPYNFQLGNFCVTEPFQAIFYLYGISE